MNMTKIAFAVAAILGASAFTASAENYSNYWGQRSYQSSDTQNGKFEHRDINRTVNDLGGKLRG